MSHNTIKVTVSLPPMLMKQVGNIAKYDLSNRSFIVRQALVEYISQPRRYDIANPDAAKTEKMYEPIKSENPFVDPGDTELIQLLYDLKMKQS